LNAETHAFLAALALNLHRRDGVSANRKERLIERDMRQVENVSPDRLETLLDMIAGLGCHLGVQISAPGDI
jgi:hypothetical protein